jgi:hypothetical protein
MEPVEPESVDTPPPVDAEATELVSAAIELESESILKEVERLDDALSRKQGNHESTDPEQTTDVEFAKQGYENIIIPDDEIILETPADAWQQLGPDVRAQPSARDNERISTSVDRMRAMLNPVTEPETDAEQRHAAAPTVEPSGVKRRGLQRTELPPELDPLRDGGIEGAADAAERSTLSALYSRPELDTPATKSESSVTAWIGLAWFVGFVALLLAAMWQIRDFYLSDNGVLSNCGLRAATTPRFPPHRPCGYECGDPPGCPRRLTRGRQFGQSCRVFPVTAVIRSDTERQIGPYSRPAYVHTKGLCYLYR